MNILNAIVLGIVQGVTEFLPVSSSGHLVLLQKITGITGPALFFDTMLHCGTLAAVCVVLRKDIWELIKKPIQPMVLFLIIATIPAVLAALALGKTIDSIFESGKYLGAAFLVTAFLLSLAETFSKQALAEGESSDENTDVSSIDKKPSLRSSMNFIDSVVIGILQAVAIIPGVSRSGATISGGLFRKLDKDLAARFSFLLSIPAILGAVVLQIRNILKLGMTDISVSGEINIAAVIIGTIIAAVVGFFAIRFMLKIIREKSLRPFAIYTAGLGILILFDQFKTHLIF